MLSLDQAIFLLSFLSLFFLLIPFGETPAGIGLMGAVALLFIVFRRHVSLSAITRSVVASWTSVLLIILVLLTFASLFVTISIPATLHAGMLYLLGFVSFSFFLSAHQGWLSAKLITVGLVLIGVVLSCCVVAFLLAPGLVLLLPTVNLLAATYGHNHAAAYLLLVLPLSVLVWKEKYLQCWSAWPFYAVLIGLCLCFGRVTLVLGVLELGVICLVVDQALRRKLMKVAVAVGVFLVLLLVLNTVLRSSYQTGCVLPLFRNQLCRPIMEETRPEFWQEALQAVRVKPWTGWGGGTFPVISQLFAPNGYSYSAYAHNFYLQFGAEYGVITSIVLLSVMLMIGREAWSVIRSEVQQKKLSFRLCLSLSMGALLINAFLDYDLSYLFMWLSFMICTALLLRETLDKSDTKRKHSAETSAAQAMITFFNQAMLVIASVVLLSWSGLFIWSSWLWWQGYPERSLQTFPFVYWRVQQELGTTQISTNLTHSLLQLYSSDEVMWYSYAQRVTDPPEQDRAFEHVLQLDRWNAAVRFHLLYQLYQQQNWDELIQQMEEVNKVYPGELRWKVPDNNRQAYLLYTVQAANQLLSQQPDKGLRILNLIYQFEPDQTAVLPIDLLLKPSQYDPQLLERYLSGIKSNQDVWPYQERLVNRFMEVAQVAAQQDQGQEVLSYTHRVTWLNPGYTGVVWQKISTALEARFQAQLQAGQQSQAEQTLQTWTAVLTELRRDGKPQQISPLYFDQLALSYLQLGDTFIASDLHQTLKDYEMSTQIDPYVFAKRPLFFEAHPDQRPFAAQYLILVHQAGEDLTLAYPLKQKEYQGFINDLVTAQNWNQAEQLIKVMNERFADDYWVAAQLGNFYALRGEYDQARVAYQACLQQTAGKSEICVQGLKLLSEPKVPSTELQHLWVLTTQDILSYSPASH